MADMLYMENICILALSYMETIYSKWREEEIHADDAYKTVKTQLSQHTTDVGRIVGSKSAVRAFNQPDQHTGNPGHRRKTRWKAVLELHDAYNLLKILTYILYAKRISTDRISLGGNVIASN